MPISWKLSYDSKQPLSFPRSTNIMMYCHHKVRYQMQINVLPTNKMPIHNGANMFFMKLSSPLHFSLLFHSTWNPLKRRCVLCILIMNYTNTYMTKMQGIQIYIYIYIYIYICNITFGSNKTKFCFWHLLMLKQWQK